MMRYALPLALSSIALVAANPAMANVEVTSKGPIVSLSVTEKVKSEPDIASISAGVTTRAMTSVEAMQKNAREMAAIIAQIKASGVKDEDIQTSGVQLDARFEYDNKTERQIFKAYQATNRVSVTLRDVKGIGPVMDSLVRAGANELSGPRFSIEDDSAAQAQARKSAMDRALTMARDYARWAGYSDVRLIEISENVRPSSVQPMMAQVRLTGEPGDLSTPIQPGMVETGVTLSTSFEMVR